MNSNKNIKLLLECNIHNCKKERNEIIKKSKQNISNIFKILNDITNKKITEKQGAKMFRDLTIKLYKSSERLQLITCQLNKCYNETKNLLDFTYKKFIKNEKDPRYKIVKNYKNKFDKKIIPRYLQKYDIEMVKIFNN